MCIVRISLMHARALYCCMFFSLPLYNVPKKIPLSLQTQKTIQNILKEEPTKVERHVSIHIEKGSQPHHPFFEDILPLCLENNSWDSIRYMLYNCSTPFNNKDIDDNEVLKKALKNNDLQLAFKLIISPSINLESKNHRSLLIYLLLRYNADPQPFDENPDLYTKICPALINKGIPLNIEFIIGGEEVTVLSMAICCAHHKKGTDFTRKTFSRLAAYMLEYGANPLIDLRYSHEDTILSKTLRKKLLYSSKLYSYVPISLDLKGYNIHPNEEKYLKHRTRIINNFHPKITTDICNVEFFRTLGCLALHTKFDKGDTTFLFS